MVIFLVAVHFVLHLVKPAFFTAPASICLSTLALVFAVIGLGAGEGQW
jgi:hypothetical protein